MSSMSWLCVSLFCALLLISRASEIDDLYTEFNAATTEILSQLHHDPWHPAHQGSEDLNTRAAVVATQELAETDPWRPKHEGSDDEETKFEEPIETQMLLNEKQHKAAVKASYQSNVKTIYFHLEEIIKKILAHKTKWTAKYNGDLGKIAQEVLKHKEKAKAAEKKYIGAKGKASAAKKLSDLKNKSWQKAKNKLKQKIDDAKKQKKALKGLYLKGLKQKAGEICMIRKIECMVAKFNGEKALQAQYCGDCKEMKAFEKVSGGSSSDIYRRVKITFGNKSIKNYMYKNICPKVAARMKGTFRCPTSDGGCMEYLQFANKKQYDKYMAWISTSTFISQFVKKLKKSGSTFTKYQKISSSEFNLGISKSGCSQVSPGA
jgi:hypothetical protein